jgi:hypothetical protein
VSGVLFRTTLRKTLFKENEKKFLNEVLKKDPMFLYGSSIFSASLQLMPRWYFN